MSEPAFCPPLSCIVPKTHAHAYIHKKAIALTQLPPRRRRLARTGLHYIHTQSILHRDLKLSNVLVSKHGHVKLADLGLARSYIAEEENPLTNNVITLWRVAVM